MSHSSTSVASTGSNCNIQTSETTLEGTESEEELLGSPMKLSPSSKLQVNHGHFMASMNGNNIGMVNGKSTSPRGNGSNPASAVNGLGSSSPTKETNFTGAPGSGKVIEILHQQVDALTTANLQLTKQSNHLLEKLESHNTKEAKYLETISSLKHENENLNSMLNRKTRRVKDLDAELSQLKTVYENVNNNYQQLKTQLESEFAHEAALEEQCKYLQVQYDAIVDSQKRYRGHYENEVSQLREALDELTRSSEQLLSEQAAVLTKDQLDLDKKLNEYNGRFHRMELLQKEAICELNDKYDRMKSSLDIESWVTLYKQVRETALEYAKEMDVTLPQEFVESHGDESYFVKKLQEQSTPPISHFEINSAEVPPLQAISQLPSQLSSPPLRLPKNRVLTSKRSSFYGGTQPGINSVVNTSSVLLPGVKRNGSVRSFHGRATSDVVSDTPTLYSSSRNASPIDLSQRNTLRQTSMQKYRKNQSSQFSSNK